MSDQTQAAAAAAAGAAAALQPTKNPPVAGPKQGAAKTGGTVTVACKHPMGLVLQLCRPEEISEDVMGGGKRVSKIWRKFGREVTVNGPSHAVDKAPRSRIVGGYALTQGVDAEFFDLWMEQNKQNPMVESGMIWAHARQDHVVAWAHEHKATRSGMEPMLPENDPRRPMPLGDGLSDIKIDEQSAKPAPAPEFEDA